jgi:hypothetical protein
MSDLKFGAGASSLRFGSAARKRPGVAGVASDQPSGDKSLDAAWLALEAANDLGDQATIEVCRRVIDASLNGTPVSQSDLQLILDYFR